MWLVYAITAAVLWGLNYSLSEKIFVENLTIQTFLALQMLLGGVIFFVSSYFTSFKQDIVLLQNKPNLLWLLLAAIAVAQIANFLISLSIKAKNATVAGLIELTYPLFTVLFTWLLFHQNHAKPSVIVGGILIFVGVFVMSYY